MKIIFILLITSSLFASTTANTTSIVDGTIDFTAHEIFQLKVHTLYQKASMCEPLKVDYHTGMTVHNWLAKEPAIPSWKTLKNFTKVAYEARDYASVHYGRDKIKHCFAGCYVRKKLGLKAAVMLGWLKELLDASDCKSDSQFEEGDYIATVAGAIGGEFSSCEDFCHRQDIKHATTQEMLDIAAKENNIDIAQVLNK